MGIKMPETCWAVFKRQAINLRDWCIWLVDLFEYMMMHGLTNPKCRVLFQNKINFRYCASGWFYYRNILRCTVLQTSSLLIRIRLTFSCLNYTTVYAIFYIGFSNLSSNSQSSVFYFFLSPLLFIIVSSSHFFFSFPRFTIYFSSSCEMQVINYTGMTHPTTAPRNFSPKPHTQT